MSSNQTSSIIVAVGTLNEGKLRACRNGFKEWYSRDDGDDFAFSYKGIKVSSGVRDQPIGVEETRKGAVNRARNAYGEVSNETTQRVIGMGLESGVLKTNDGVVFDFCVAALYDGKTSRTCTGISSMFALPAVVSKRMFDMGYNGAFKAAGVEPDDKGDGVLSVLSEGRLSRPLQTKQAIFAAMVSHHDKSGLYTKE